MFDTRHNLFQAILDQPDEAPLRLVYADWLEEQGDSPRAELIRVQLELARSDPNQDLFKELQSRQDDLLALHERHWNAPVHRFFKERAPRLTVCRRRGAVRGWAYWRGFIEHLTVQTPAILEHGPLLFQIGPIRHLELHMAEGRLDELSRQPWFPLVRSLYLKSPRLTVHELLRFFESSRLVQLRRFSLDNPAPAVIWSLAASPLSRQLDEFCLHGHPDSAMRSALERGFGDRVRYYSRRLPAHETTRTPQVPPQQPPSLLGRLRAFIGR